MIARKREHRFRLFPQVVIHLEGPAELFHYVNCFPKGQNRSQGSVPRLISPYSRLWFFLISTFSRLIFWFRVESGMRKRSAASVWFQLHFSSMSLMMRRSQSSMISYSEASEA